MNNPVRNIVVAVRDQASGSKAVRRAFALARPGVDIVHLLHVERTINWTLAAGLMQPHWLNPAQTEAEARHPWIAQLAQTARAAGQRVEFNVVSGSPAKVVNEYADEVGADLIVVAGPRDSLLRELFIGSTASKILRHSHCPVLVSRSDPDQLPQYGRVLLAVDHEHEEMAYSLTRLSAQFFANPQFHLAHAYRVPEEHVLRMRGASEEEIDALRLAMQPRHENAMRPFADSLPGVKLHVQHGYPSSVLLELSEQIQPDIVVIGKHRGSNLEERVLGSVTQFLLYAIKSDFLLVG